MWVRLTARRGVEPGFGGALGGPQHLALHLHEADAGPAERDEPVDGIGAGAQGRGTGEELPLQCLFGVVEQGTHESRAGAEAPEDGALADPGAGGDGIHRDRVDAAFGDEERGRLEEPAPVAGGVASFDALVPGERQ